MPPIRQPRATGGDPILLPGRSGVSPRFGGPEAPPALRAGSPRGRGSYPTIQAKAVSEPHPSFIARRFPQ